MYLCLKGNGSMLKLRELPVLPMSNSEVLRLSASSGSSLILSCYLDERWSINHDRKAFQRIVSIVHGAFSKGDVTADIGYPRPMQAGYKYLSGIRTVS